MLNWLAPCIIDFAAGVRSLELSLSSKAMLVASHPKLASMLKHELSTYSIEFQIPNTKEGARDLGISNTAGIHRPSRILSNRHRNSKHRISKIKGLAKLNRKSKVLFSASALPASTWGRQAAGIASSTLRRLEDDALGCTGIGKGRCHYAALVVFYGLSSTPYARLLLELCEAWSRILKGSFLSGCISHTDLRGAWAKAKKELLSKTIGRINSIKGIMSNIIYNLLSLSWLPVSYDLWTDEHNHAWQLDLLDSPKGIIRQLVSSYELQQCAEASKHHNGLGMENGVYWTATLAYLQSHF